ncbi:MAG: hypothetical protein ACJ790_13770 [Myxococcaceae bacterium]
MVRVIAVSVAVASLLLLSCKSGEDKAKERQEKLETQKAEYKAAQAKGDAPKTDTAPKDPYWDDPSLIEISDEGKCPEGIWALFPGSAPGADAAEKKANESKRAELAKSLREKSFTLKLRTGRGVELQDYNAAKGFYPVEVKTSVDCKDSAGTVTIAVGDAKAQTPPNSAAKEGAGQTMRIWWSPPAEFTVPMKSMSDAKAWKDKNLLGLEARYVFKLGKAEIDRKAVKVEKHVEKTSVGDIKIGGGSEDWGAGRMVRGDVEKMRLTVDHGQTVLAQGK